VDEEPGAGDARLTRSREYAGNHAVVRGFEVRVVEDDVRRLAVELQADPGEVDWRVLHYAYSRRGGAGERHLVHARVTHQRTARLLSETRDHVDDAWREARLVDELRKLQCGGAGVCSAGFTTTVQPAASAGTNLKVKRSSGEFHGTMAPTTPIDSLLAWTKKVGLS
jgi:hypothetical protein